MRSSHASSTAKVIAASTILLESERHSRGMVAAGAADLCKFLLSGSFADRCLAGSACHISTRWFWRTVEQFTLPGIISHYWHRKRWIEKRCRAAIADGFERVVILGAGFDTLGIRLSCEFAQLHVLEMDHPATQGAKITALARNRVDLSENLKFVTLDLIDGKLPPSCFDRKPTVFILEGVLMYLPGPAVSKLLHALHQMPAERMLVIFSFMTKWPDGRAGFRPHSWLIEKWLAWREEPFTWAIEPEIMTNFLATHDFKLLEMATTRELDETDRLQASSLDGENLVVCEPSRS